jgi:excisionase family DNA binding protein
VTATVQRLLLTKREAAESMSVSERTIDNWRTAGKLPAVIIGTHPRFDVRDLQRLIDQHKECTATVQSGPTVPQ